MRPRRLVSLLVAGCMVVSMVPASAVTAFADAGAGTSVTEQVGSTAYQKLAKAIADAKAGDTITLSEDVDVQQTLVVDKKLTLDLAGHKLYNTNDLWDKPTAQDNNWSLISVRGNGDLTITGNGVLDAKENDCYAVDLQDEATKLTIENGEFIGNITAIYAHTGEAVINGGKFWIRQLNANNVQDGYGLTLNCLDANHRADIANIIVTGGTFHFFNPANNRAEGSGTNFCPVGYTATQDGDWYTVAPRTYDDVKTDVKPEEKPDTTVNGEKDEPVDIDVTISGDQEQMECIDTVSLNFSDVSAVKKVELSASGRTISLDKYAATEYQDMPLEELMEAFRDAEDGTSAAQIALCDVESAENGPEEEETNATTLTLHVTYKTEGRYKVGVVFKDPNSTVISEQSANVQIGEVKASLTFTDCTATVDGKEIASGDEVAEGKTVTLKLAANVDQMKFGGFVLDPQQDSLKKVDDTTATFIMPNAPVTVTVQLNAEDSDSSSWDAATVVAGVAVGAGTAVLAYHIGTEVYAEQVLGKGVAVPKTRADVALKAWELAGKPAVAVGEPLSEAAQAEKWAVESGLMQNDAQGNFNGQKKMNKLAALRTLDAAKKLG